MVTVLVRIFTISTLRLLMRSRASSNSSALVRAPRMSISFLVITSVGRLVSFLGQPVRVMRPALETRSKVWRIAGLAPEHSMT